MRQRPRQLPLCLTPVVIGAILLGGATASSAELRRKNVSDASVADPCSGRCVPFVERIQHGIAFLLPGLANRRFASASVPHAPLPRRYVASNRFGPGAIREM